jgi:hypothetical protein
MNTQNEESVVKSKVALLKDEEIQNEPAKEHVEVSLGSPSHQENNVHQQILLEEKEVQEETNSNSQDTNLMKKIILITLGVLLLVIIGFGIYSLFFSKNSENEIISFLIPQPFTEDNKFLYFHLDNGLKVMIINPNSAINHSFICRLISIDCWGGI